MSPPAEATLRYVTDFVIEDDVISGARARASELGCGSVSPVTGAALGLLASLVSARAVVEIASNAGVSGLWLFRGMRPDGVLTSVDTEAEHQRVARKAFAEATIGSTRYRLINGTAAEVLPRLTDAVYDLVFVDAATPGIIGYLDHAIRLLRPSGVLVVDNTLGAGRVAEPSARDEQTLALRELARLVREDERLRPVLLPVGDGLLLAGRR